jgi:hypothetical protein
MTLYIFLGYYCDAHTIIKTLVILINKSWVKVPPLPGLDGGWVEGSNIHARVTALYFTVNNNTACM